MYLCCELTAKPWYRMPTSKYVHKLYEAFNKKFCIFLLQFNFSFMQIYNVFSRIKLIFAETPLSPPCLLFSPCFYFLVTQGLPDSSLTSTSESPWTYKWNLIYQIILFRLYPENSNNEVINLWKYIKVCFHFVHQYSIRNKNGQQ